MNHEKPQQVTNARIAGNREALRAMGKKGGETAADNRAIKDELRYLSYEKAEEKAKLESDPPYVVNPEGDVLPPH